MTATKTKPEITSIPVADIQPIEGLNPRQTISADSIAELAASIKEVGVLMPVLVAERSNGHWPLIAGNRRWLAATKAGLAEIPALVRADLAGSELEAAITENAQRLDLDPIEEAMAIRRLMDEKNLKQVDAAKAMGKSERWLRERLRLLKLPAHTQRIFAAREIPIEAAVQLERVAKLSEDAADLIAVRAKHGEIEPGSLTEQQGVAEALGAVVDERKVPVVLVASAGYLEQNEKYRPADLPITDAEVRKELKAGYEDIPKVPNRYYAEGPRHRDPITFDGKDAAAAKKAGCLHEFKMTTRWGQAVTRRYIAGEQFIAELVRQKLPKMKASHQRKKREAEKEIAEREARRNKADGDRAQQTEKVDAKEQRRRELAEKANTELADRLRGLQLAEPSFEAVRLVCTLALGDSENVDQVLLDGLSKIDPAYELDEERERTENYPGDQVLAELASAETPGAAIAVVLKAMVALRFADLPTNEPWALRNAGPVHGELELTAQIDTVAAGLDLLPTPMAKWAEAKAKKRLELAREAAERAARVCDGQDLLVLGALADLKAPIAESDPRLLEPFGHGRELDFERTVDRLVEAGHTERLSAPKPEDLDDEHEAVEQLQITDAGRKRLVELGKDASK